MADLSTSLTAFCNATVDRGTARVLELLADRPFEKVVAAVGHTLLHDGIDRLKEVCKTGPLSF